jgi:hypothetical protein
MFIVIFCIIMTITIVINEGDSNRDIIDHICEIPILCYQVDKLVSSSAILKCNGSERRGCTRPTPQYIPHW